MSEFESATSSALLYGHDEALVLSRKALLSIVDCSCLIVLSLEKCLQALVARPFDLLVLCQTVSGEDGAFALEFAAKHCSEMPLLIMFSRHVRCTPQQNYILLDTMAGPEAFIKTARRMMVNEVAFADSPPC